MRGIDSCLIHDHGDERVPMVLFNLHPIARSTPAETGRMIMVCPNTAAAAHALLGELEDFALTSPRPSADEVIRSMPRYVWGRYDPHDRALAYKAWRIYGPRFLSGHYADLHRIWHTDGSAKIPDVPSVRDLAALARWPRALRRRLSRL